MVLGTVTSTAHAVDPPAVDPAATVTVAPADALNAPCSAPLVVILASHSTSGTSVTLYYSITGCVGSVRLHIHLNLATAPVASSDTQHQININVSLTKDSPMSQTVQLPTGLAGECFVQIDYSTPTQRKGFFVPAPACPAAAPTSAVPSISAQASSTPAPTTSVTSSNSGVPSSTSVTPSSAVSAVAVVPGRSRSAQPVARQVGPIPQTGFSGDVVTVRMHPYRWATVVGIVLFALGAAGLLRLATNRRESTN